MTVLLVTTTPTSFSSAYSWMAFATEAFHSTEPTTVSTDSSVADSAAEQPYQALLGVAAAYPTISTAEAGLPGTAALVASTVWPPKDGCELAMSNQYITSEEHLPAELGSETTMQITDAETKRIFEARVRIARDPDELTDPCRLTVVAGPHESIRKELYVELLDEFDAAGINEDLLRRLAEEQPAASNIINTRSNDLKVVLRYLVEAGEYESTAAALREIAFQHLAIERPALLRTYENVRTEFESDPLRDALTEQD